MIQRNQPSFHYTYKIYLSILALALMFVISLPAGAEAAAGIVTGTVVNVRSSPASSGAIIGTILKDTEVEITGISGNWYQIKYAGLQGYIARELITARQQVQIKDGPVNARSGPGTTYDIVASLGDKIIFTVLGEQNGWYQIQLPDGNPAFVAGWLVTQVTDTVPETKTVTTSPTTATANQSTMAAAQPVSTLANPTVNLNGSRLQFEVEPRIENGRTLVPLRAIFEAMGASVDWNETTRTVTARRGGTTVVLSIGSTSPTVNGKAWTLDVPAKIVNDRTLAPLRFVGEAFGGTVEWNEQTRVINITSTSVVVPAAVLVTGGSVNLREAPSTDAAIVDVAQVGEKMNVLAEKNSWYQVSRGGRNVWVAAWVVEPLTDAIAGDNNNTSNSSESSGTSEGSMTENPEVINENDINRHGDENAAVAKGSITISTRLANDGYRLVMKTGEASDPQITKSSDSKKITYKFENAVLKSTRDEAYFYIGTGKNAKVTISAQTMDENTWVTIEMPLAYQYACTTEADGCRQVFTITSQLTSVEDITLKNGNQIIVLRATSAMQYKDSFSDGKITLNLGKTGQGFVENSYLFGGLVGRVSITEDSDNLLQVKVNTSSNMETYQVNRSVNGLKISIILVNKEKVEEEPTPSDESPSKAVTIVLDPGHGGRDTGAISKDRTLNEKDVVLSIGLKTRDILEKAGYKVIMTRKDDTYVGLSERPAMANQAGADLFVSIHCDSVDSTEPHGTGTFYYAPETTPALYAQEYQRSLLADLLQKAMLDKCGRTDRSIRQANYAVLRESNMPSALVETAFISNTEEAQLLASADFQTKAAQAIAEGIQKYIKLML
jgi:N-acetylmuramoyl-L-alanine amidase